MSLSASLQKIDQRIFIKGEHQAAVVYLGQLSLSGVTAADLAAQTALVVTQILQVEYSLLWELKENSQSLYLMAGMGEIERPSAFLTISTNPGSLEETTLVRADPIVIGRSQNSFKPALLGTTAVPGMESGVSVRIGTTEKPYGILQVFSVRGQFFSQDDLHFLQSVANLLAMAIHQARARQELAADSGMARTKLKRAVRSGHMEWDRYEIKNRLVVSQERERLRLAKDLHDVPIQDLYGMIYQLDDLRDAVRDREEEEILDECDHTLHRVVNSLRTICRELRPPSLSPFGLEVAIRDHVEKFRDQNPEIEVHLDLMQDGQVFSDIVRLTLFRIYQQAIYNIARHAHASEVHIRFRWDEKTIILEVEDNGLGFEVPKNWVELVREEHFGLLDIAERVESIRGTLEIVSAPGSGTLLRAITPYSKSGTG